MNEPVKTAGYAAAAVVVALIAYAARPNFEDIEPTDAVGQELFEEFTDPSTATGLKIVKFEETDSKPKSFEVKRASEDAPWSIPSHSGYPADAEDQMKTAATGLMGLNVLGVASELPGDHELLGVLRPSDETKLGDSGIGTLVALTTKDGDTYEMIIGKKVPQSEDLYFVRRGSQSVTYEVKLNPEDFSTDFEKWIEQDVLDISSWDIKQVQIQDYAVFREGNVFQTSYSLSRKHDITVSFDNNEWKLNEMLTYGPNGQPVATELGDFEELDSTKLNDLKTAVDELKIIDVEAKPAGLGANLKAEASLLQDREGLLSLQSKGFYLDQSSQLRCANGEFHVWDDDNIEFILRFGNVASSTEGDDDVALNRYLFVTARVDESRIEQPELEEVPELPAKAEPVGPAAEDGNDAAKAESGDEAATEKEADGPEVDADEERAKIEKEIERITKANQEKIDARAKKVKDAQEKVNELNARFADWYYVISEESYSKIHLSRADIIKESEEAKKEGFGIDAFRGLEEEGLKKDDSE